MQAHCTAGRCRECTPEHRENLLGTTVLYPAQPLFPFHLCRGSGVSPRKNSETVNARGGIALIEVQPFYTALLWYESHL